MSFKEELRTKTEKIEKLLTTYLPQETGFQKTVLEAVNYSVLAGGKRLRPLLMKETYQMFGGEGKVVEPFMAAMEMIHTYSLVHDDLPAGAFDMETSPRTAKALQILSGKAGIYGMIGGQVVDVESEGQPLSREKLDFIYRLKTSALIEAAMMVGAVLAGASDEEVAAMERVAGDVGLAFQIQDDILDVTSTLEVLGKPIHSDDKNNKTTYVTLEGLDKAKKDVEEISERALSTLASLEHKNAFLEELIRMLITREK